MPEAGTDVAASVLGLLPVLLPDAAAPLPSDSAHAAYGQVWLREWDLSVEPVVELSLSR